MTPKLQKLLLSGKRSAYDKGQVVQSSDDKQVFSMVERGYVKRYLITNDGGIAVQSIYGPGQFFPLTHAYRSLLQTDIYTGNEVYFYETMCSSTVYSIEDETLHKSVDADPLLYRDLLLVAGRRLKSNIQRLENLSLHSYYNRVAHQLLYFALNNGQKTAKGICIKIPLTQQDIADILSTTRETVSLCVSQLRKKNVIIASRNVVVPNLDKLRAEIET